VCRNREAVHEKLVEDYFVEDLVYNFVFFRWRFGMRRELFLREVDGVTEFDLYFVQR
jgi:hypothetical protein